MLLPAADFDEHILQNDLKILAALSHSLSRVVGQKASDPILFESLLTGAPTGLCQFLRQSRGGLHLTFVGPTPSFIKTLLTAGLGLVPRGQNGSDLLHSGRSFERGSCAGGAARHRIQAVLKILGWRGRTLGNDAAAAYAN